MACFLSRTAPFLSLFGQKGKDEEISNFGTKPWTINPFRIMSDFPLSSVNVFIVLSGLFSIYNGT